MQRACFSEDMKTKNIIIALLVLAVLSGLNFFNQSRQARLKQSYASKAGPEQILPSGVDAKQIDRIRIFVEKPISLTFLVMAVVSLIYALRKHKKSA